MKQFLTYAGRWQLSTLTLWPVIALVNQTDIPCKALWGAVIGNVIGSMIFFFVDKRIFARNVEN